MQLPTHVYRLCSLRCQFCVRELTSCVMQIEAVTSLSDFVQINQFPSINNA